MKATNLLRGVATISFYADDVASAKRWYSDLLGLEPYFQRPDAVNPAYVEFRLGDYQHELGIIDRRYQPKAAAGGVGGAVVFWHVDDIEAALARVKEMGATEYEPLIKREAGFITASVIDPFGNILGLMYNPHYLKVLGELKSA